ncbi:MAG: hypothetical protein JWL61_112 [Gemmatimonadetes bacterium]|nr:hypothetical protein [Gemmatimonadota bacterium]
MLAFALLVVVARPAVAAEGSLELARGGRTEYVITTDASTGETGRFAALELSSYLGRISGAAFRISASSGARKVITLRLERASSPDDYTIAVNGDTLALSGSTPRAVLFATYDLLTRLGCRFIAPQLSFYAPGEAEHVPHAETLVYRGATRVAEHPAFAMRKLNVEEGLSHDSASLQAIVAWMPKARFNTISVPMDYGGGGRVKWDNWRVSLTPELRRRGMDVEVGGHGYQNFLNASMQDGAVFAQHPDWFGRDSTCAPSRAPQNVFNTTNAGAVAFVTTEATRYLRERGEIDVLELWPPDGARWSACASTSTEGAPDRQARLLNTVSAALREARPGARVQTIAYDEAKEPPSHVMLDARILVDVCPIGQNFDFAIDDTRGPNNAQYAALIRNWRRSFTGHLGLYSYYRRYAWLSLPVILPHYMQHDLQWYASVPMQGISTYAEPGDWYTYELNHWVFAQLAWNPDIDVDTAVAEYVHIRYPTDAKAAGVAYATLEDVVRRFGSIQYATPKTAAEIRSARERIDAVRKRFDPRYSQRLDLMLDYASRDLAIQERRAVGDTAAMRPLVAQLVDFHVKYADKGVFLLSGRNDRARIFRHYSLPAER